jgi:hypothetical protein
MLQSGNSRRLCAFPIQPNPEARQQLGLVARCKAGAGSISDPLPASL